MRVISGTLKGRTIKGYNLEGTRPTMDRIKESLFAMIQNNIKDTICLDLFAGSGSLGIEAISNGAKYVYFIDYQKEAIKVIKDNIINFKIEDKSHIMLNDYHQALDYFKNNNIKFDLIFLDPPYHDHLINEVLSYIDEFKLLNDNGQVICEYTDEDLKDEYRNLILIKERQYGDKYIKIYKKC